MFRFIYQSATAARLVASIICLVLIALIFSHTSGIYWQVIGWEGEVKLLDMEFFHFYGAEYADAFLDGMTVGRQALYLGFYLLAMCFAVAYFFVFSFAIALIYRKVARGGRQPYWLIAVPFTAALFDLTENGLISTMVVLPQTRIVSVPELTSIASMVKCTAQGAVALVILAGIAMLVLRRFSDRTPATA